MYVIFTNNQQTYREAQKNGDQIFTLDCNNERPTLTSGKEKNPKDESPEKKVEKKISNFLKRIGIGPHLKGYHYLLATFKNYWKDPDFAKNGLTKELYPQLAKEFSATSGAIERGIRHAIKLSWIRGDVDFLDELFSYSYDPAKPHPTNNQFISTALDYLKENVF